MTELTISASEITDALRKHVTDFNPAVAAEQVGRVVEVGDGIARVSGLPSAKVNELLHVLGGLRQNVAVYAVVAYLDELGREVIPALASIQSVSLVDRTLLEERASATQH